MKRGRRNGRKITMSVVLRERKRRRKERRE